MHTLKQDFAAVRRADALHSLPTGALPSAAVPAASLPNSRAPSPVVQGPMAQGGIQGSPGAWSAGQAQSALPRQIGQSHGPAGTAAAAGLPTGSARLATRPPLAVTTPAQQAGSAGSAAASAAASTCPVTCPAGAATPCATPTRPACAASLHEQNAVLKARLDAINQQVRRGSTPGR